jgi:hypothetical protein
MPFSCGSAPSARLPKFVLSLSKIATTIYQIF